MPIDSRGPQTWGDAFRAPRSRLSFGLVFMLATRPTPVPVGTLELPAQLKSYRTWRAVAAEPFQVPYELWIQCVHPSREQEARAAREHGPHSRLAIQVFTNPIASALFYSDSRGPLPEGSIVVKEKSVEGGSSPVAVAAMIKGARGSASASGDWKFLYVTSRGPVVATELCRDCHRTAATDDLFRSYPSPSR
jgi:hypothetical protein